MIEKGSTGAELLQVEKLVSATPHRLCLMRARALMAEILSATNREELGLSRATQRAVCDEVDKTART